MNAAKEDWYLVIGKSNLKCETSVIAVIVVFRALECSRVFGMLVY